MAVVQSLSGARYVTNAQKLSQSYVIFPDSSTQTAFSESVISLLRNPFHTVQMNLSHSKVQKLTLLLLAQVQLRGVSIFARTGFLRATAVPAGTAESAC